LSRAFVYKYFYPLILFIFFTVNLCGNWNRNQNMELVDGKVLPLDIAEIIDEASE